MAEEISPIDVQFAPLWVERDNWYWYPAGKNSLFSISIHSQSKWVEKNRPILLKTVYISANLSASLELPAPQNRTDFRQSSKMFKNKYDVIVVSKSNNVMLVYRNKL